MNLRELRENIDTLDFEIIRLIHARMEKALLTKKFKEKIEDSSREDELLVKLENYGSLLGHKEFYVELFQKILDYSKYLQNKELKLISFSGEHGSAGEIAARLWNNSLVFIPCKNEMTQLEGIKQGIYDYGIFELNEKPDKVRREIVNLLSAGVIKEVDRMETEIPVALLAMPKTEVGNIQVVYASPKIFNRTVNFLAGYKWGKIICTECAAIARFIANERKSEAAVIATELAAQFYNLEILKKNITDSPVIRKFVILQKNY